MSSLCFGVFVFFDILWQANKKSELVKKKNDVVFLLLQLPQNNDEKCQIQANRDVSLILPYAQCSKILKNVEFRGSRTVFVKG